ncbi:MAG: M55 family metallopeptidase [Bacilli bacterium]|jgi:D-amino peptidase|nr:M55 family metallopeptidase [Bacilli bacterium]
MSNVKKVFISADIEGVNNIVSWDETELKDSEYTYFRKQMTEEVKRACIACHEAGVEEIFVKDAHDYARNIIFSELPSYVKLHRGWEGGPCSMMAGLDSSFDCVMFIGYHSPSKSDGNPLAHTMNTRINYVKINGEIASEFLINSLYASYLGVPIAFLSGDENMTKLAKQANPNIKTVATKVGSHGAVISEHPEVTNKRIEEQVKLALEGDLSQNIVLLPKKIEIEVDYKTHKEAYSASFFPGCKLKTSSSIEFKTNDYAKAIVMMKFTL